MCGNTPAYYVYILRCQDGSLYTGITTDPARRFAEHASQKGKAARYTISHKMLRPESLWLTATRQSASRLEYRIKTLSRAQKEELLRSPDCLEKFFGGKLNASAYQPLSPGTF